MRRGPFGLLLLLVVTAAAGCASSGAAEGGGGYYSDLDCTDPSIVAPGYGYSYDSYYGPDNPCFAYPARYYVSPTPQSAARNVVLVEAPRPHTTTVNRPDFSGLTSLNSDYGIVSRDPSSTTIAPAAPIVPVTSTPTTTTIAPRGSN